MKSEEVWPSFSKTEATKSCDSMFLFVCFLSQGDVVAELLFHLKLDREW